MMTKRVWLRVVVCSLFLCCIEAAAGGALRAQVVAPVGVRPRPSPNTAAVQTTLTWSIFARPSTSDSPGTDRMRHAVIGAAIGAVAGVAIGYHHGKVEDARCSSECGGPRIATLVDPPLFGLLGGAIGAVVGYVFPTGA